MKLNDLFEKGLLKRINPDDEIVRQSVRLSEKFFEDSEKLFKMNIYELAIVSAYSSMFHAARAILFQEGIQEKSHFAVVFYLREKHKELDSLIESLNTLREQRHESLYGLEAKFNKEDVIFSISIAKTFIKRIKNILKQKK